MTDEQKILIALNDPVLRPYLTAKGEEQQQRELEHLVSVRARATIEGVMSRYTNVEPGLTHEETEDLAAAVTMRLVHKLAATRSSPDDAIRKYDDYVARLAFNAVNDFRRRRYPERNRLKRKLRFILTSHPAFAVWDSPLGPVAGVAAWRDRTDVLPLHAVRLDPMPESMLDPQRVDEALQTLFKRTGRPLHFEAVTDILATAWGVHESRPLPDHFAVADPSPSQDVEYETRQTLEIVWNEIKALPPSQRAALILNLRDTVGLNAAVFLPLTGVASIEDIAALIGFDVEKLLALWNQLPLPDEAIAQVLGKTRQQVINLRTSASERLKRRLSSHERPRKA